MTEIKVRRGEIGDADFLADSSVAMAHESEGVTLDRERLLRGIAATFENPGRGEYFIAEIFPAAESREGGEGKVSGAGFSGSARFPDTYSGGDEAGMASERAGTLMVTREWSDWHNAWYLWIQSVYVPPRFRRMGVYRALHIHVLEMARREGAASVRLYVDRDNTAAMETYRRLGMEKSNYEMFEWKDFRS